MNYFFRADRTIQIPVILNRISVKRSAGYVLHFAVKDFFENMRICFRNVLPYHHKGGRERLFTANYLATLLQQRGHR